MYRCCALIISLFCFCSAEALASAKSYQPKGLSSEQIANAYRLNESVQELHRSPLLQPYRPVSELDTSKYLLMTASPGYDTLEFKQVIAKHLPSEMTLVLLVKAGTEKYFSDFYSKFISRDRLIIATNDSELGFWARDTFPYPVFLDSTQNVELVKAKYPRPFKGSDAIATSVGGRIRYENFYFVGGNLLSDQNGNCFVVTSDRLFGLKDSTLMSTYGCQRVIRFPFVAGIGDADEVLRFLPDNVVLTTVPSYVSKLTSLGYTVKLLPSLSDKRTYANSVYLNGLIIMPTYGLPSDYVAKKVYESFGYRVITADSEQVSVEGNGSFHCMTMTYPAMKAEALLKSVGARRYR